MKLISNNPKKRAGYWATLEVTETVPIEIKPNKTQ